MSAPPTVLLVDAKTGTLNKLHVTLSRLSPPVRTLTATTARQALDLIAAERVDLVLSDDQVGDMSGLELLAAIARKRPDIERVAMMDAAGVALATEARRAGHVHGFIEKPVDSVVLARTIASLVGAHLRSISHDPTVDRLREIARR